VLIVPALLLFVILTIALARWATAYADLQSGALAGARAAALAADSTEGAQLAERISRQQMVSGGPNCQTLTVTTSTAALDQDPGQLGEVSVSLVCLLPLGDLTLPGLPGQVTIEAAADCPIDPFVPR
jgi:Flp pilus assembly protein TadG